MRFRIIFIFSLIFLFNSVLLTEKTNSLSSEEIISESGDNGLVDWKNKVIRVKGFGIPPQVGSQAQKKLKARLAARMDAYRNLAELINGVKVTAETAVDNYTVKSDLIRLNVEAVIKGARQVGLEKINSDSSVEVEIYLPLFGSGSLASALDLGNFIKKYESIQSFIPYRVAFLKTFKNNDYQTTLKLSENISLKNFTGLIIDAKDLGLEPAMSPFIIGGGKIIYAGGRIDIDPEKIVKNGVSDYVSDLEEAKNNVQRIGENPLIIEARGATGSPNRTNILIDELTLKQITEADEKDLFLKELKVVIVL